MQTGTMSDIFSGRISSDRMAEVLSHVPGIDQMSMHRSSRSEERTQSSSHGSHPSSSSEQEEIPQTTTIVLVSALKLIGQLAFLIEEASSKS